MLERWLPESASLVAQKMDRLFWYATAWTAGTGLIVVLILAVFIVRYRKRPGRLPFYTHGENKGSLLMTLTLAVLVFLLLDINLAYHDHVVWSAMFGHPPAGALKIQVMPEQFAWNIRYAGADDRFNTADDIVTINEMRVAAHQPVVVQMMSKDVIHSFFLPNLRIKQDAVPGMVTSLYFLPEKKGRYDIACAEHCGLGHYRMRGSFVIDTEEGMAAWLDDQAQQAAADDTPPPAWAWDWNKGPNLSRVSPIKKEPLL